MSSPRATEPNSTARRTLGSVRSARRSVDSSGQCAAAYRRSSSLTCCRRALKRSQRIVPPATARRSVRPSTSSSRASSTSSMTSSIGFRMTVPGGAVASTCASLKLQPPHARVVRAGVRGADAGPGAGVAGDLAGRACAGVGAGAPRRHRRRARRWHACLPSLQLVDRCIVVAQRRVAVHKRLTMAARSYTLPSSAGAPCCGGSGRLDASSTSLPPAGRPFSPATVVIRTWVNSASSVAASARSSASGRRSIMLSAYRPPGRRTRWTSCRPLGGHQLPRHGAVAEGVADNDVGAGGGFAFASLRERRRRWRAGRAR